MRARTRLLGALLTLRERGWRIGWWACACVAPYTLSTTRGSQLYSLLHPPFLCVFTWFHFCQPRFSQFLKQKKNKNTPVWFLGKVESANNNNNNHDTTSERLIVKQEIWLWRERETKPETGWRIKKTFEEKILLEKLNADIKTTCSSQMQPSKSSCFQKTKISTTRTIKNSNFTKKSHVLFFERIIYLVFKTTTVLALDTLLQPNSSSTADYFLIN